MLIRPERKSEWQSYLHHRKRVEDLVVSQLQEDDTERRARLSRLVGRAVLLRKRAEKRVFHVRPAAE